MTDVTGSRTFDLFDKDCIRFVKKFKSPITFTKAFRNHYDHIVAYHGTNINDEDAEAIQSDGLKCTTINLLRQRAEDRFILETDSPEQRVEIKELIQTRFMTEEYITVGEINFTLEKEPLQDQAYQYLLFGPESLFPIADYLRKKLGQNFRRRMMEYGSSTIIHALIPIATTSDYWVQGIYGYWKEGGLECCLVYRQDLPAECIIELEKVPPPRDLYNFLWI
jgi:hypothetical protein